MKEEEFLDRLCKEEDKLVSDAVAAIGVENEGAYNLMEKELPSTAVPVLLGLMRRVTHPAIKQGVIRALGTPSAKGVAERDLIRYFEEIPETEWAWEDTKWVIANTLEILASDEIGEDLIRLATESCHGRARQMIVLSLGRLRSIQVLDTLIKLLGDEDVAGQAVVALGRLGDGRALPALQPKLRDRRAWIRRAAKTSINKLSRPPK